MRDKVACKPGGSALVLLVVGSVALAGCGDHVGAKQAAADQGHDHGD